MNALEASCNIVKVGDQCISMDPNSICPQLVISISKKRPHWQAMGKDGHANIRIERNDARGFVSFDTSEFSEKASKRTMVTLEEAAARALFEFLRERFGP